MRIILDTSALIALRRKDAKVERALKTLRDTAEEIGISRLTEYGLRLGGNYLWKKYWEARELAWLDEILDWLTIYDVDEGVVRDAVEVRAERLSKGKHFLDLDLLIALSEKSGSELVTFDEDQEKMKDTLKRKGVSIHALL